ncbi:hypothetical protein MPTA5024_18830 [Microbispora sp. ATCC PTA-5024]|nr:hypothetical protein MPTA5024_18830 [Microbispora sp. ATCC PTA-5024]
MNEVQELRGIVAELVQIQRELGVSVDTRRQQ